MVLCEEETCDRNAETAFMWPWGEKGIVCGEHFKAVRHRAEALNAALVTEAIPQPVVEPTAPEEIIAGLRDELEATRAKLEELTELAAHQESTLATAQSELEENRRELAKLREAGRLAKWHPGAAASLEIRDRLVRALRMAPNDDSLLRPTLERALELATLRVPRKRRGEAVTRREGSTVVEGDK